MQPRLLHMLKDAALTALVAAALGIFIVGFLGFSHMEVVHNAGHDYRHSMAFPCH